MNYDAYSFVMDFAFMSLFLIVAQFLRSKIKFLQRFYIPASVLAGIMGLICGPQVLNVIPWSGKIGSYAYLLICIVFAGLYLGKKENPCLPAKLLKCAVRRVRVEESVWHCSFVLIVQEAWGRVPLSDT